MSSSHKPLVKTAKPAKRFLVFGKSGLLAQSIAGLPSYKHYEILFSSSSQFDLAARHTEIYDYIVKHSPLDGIINAAAYTNVDGAEIQNCEQAFILNALAPEQMARACRDLDIPFLHVSTDTVFDGNQSTPYKENDTCNPLNFYGFSKREGEISVQNIGHRGAIFRTSWVFSNHGNNFLPIMLKLAKTQNPIRVVSDQIGMPTYANNLADALLHACIHMRDNPKINDTAPIYHITNTGKAVSRYEFAKEIFKAAGLSPNVRTISAKSFAALAERPSYCVLDTNKFTQAFDYNLPNWQDGLKQVFAK